MTIKAKRAKALRVMEPDEVITGAIVDESLPAKAEAVLADLSERFGPNLAVRFRTRFGIYRATNDALQSTPAIAEEIQLAKEAHRTIQEAMNRLDNLPPALDSFISQASLARHGRLFHSGPLIDFLTMGDQILSLLEYAEQQLDELPKKGGRKSEQARNNLLSDTAEMLHKLSAKKLTKQKVAVEVVRLLSAANVDLPTDLAEVERLIRDSKKLGKIARN